MRIVGKGSFGIVRQCKSLLDNKVYAVKTIQLRDKKVEDKMCEVEILKDLKHPNIIEFCGFFVG